MERMLTALEGLRNRVEGREMSLLQMDNEVMAFGFCSIAGVCPREILADENAVIWFDDGDFDKGIQVFFEVTETAGEDEIVEAALVRIISVEVF